MAELGEFWSISTWGCDNRTHCAASMTLDGGNIKQWGKANGVKVTVASFTAQYNAPNWKWWPSRPTN